MARPNPEREARKAANRQRVIEETLQRATIRILERRAKLAPTCAECGGVGAELVGGDAIYGYRAGFSDKLYWRCPCGAYCGVHKGTERPMGRPAHEPTRRARSAAHAALDGLWRRKMARDGVDQKDARGAAYRWLAGQLGLTPDETHIGLFDRATAERVVAICSNLGKAR